MNGTYSLLPTLNSLPSNVIFLTAGSSSLPCPEITSPPPPRSALFPPLRMVSTSILSLLLKMVSISTLFLPWRMVTVPRLTLPLLLKMVWTSVGVYDAAERRERRLGIAVPYSLTQRLEGRSTLRRNIAIAYIYGS
ncbi:hypothetical protein PYCCODRAFT_335481 [Trametes coccinea BRFM310]|uniref:Uncharacterized protein n=1 Tax=Trametes coccinea (strain BRFM310) TaxID=1353009 RepID=A0A1Y2J427_TRAC3|nr:hypothetical protein PYCCODRAFT_335481 [Trametes coccinea BRFM310]